MITRVSLAACPMGDHCPCAFLISGERELAVATHSVACAPEQFIVDAVPGPARLFSGHIHRRGQRMDFQLRTLIEIDCLDAQAAETLWHENHFARHTRDDDTDITCVGVAADLSRGAPCTRGAVRRSA